MRRYLNLALAFAICEFKIRYQDSWLGYVWSFLKPLLLFGTLYIVFSVLLGFKTPHYPVYLFLGIILWNFLVESTTFSMHQVWQRAELIKKIYFPRSVIPISATFTAGLTLLVNLVVFAVFFFVSGVSVHWTILVFPLLLLELYLVVLGLSLAIAALVVKFRDLLHIWEVLLQLGFWGTPIIYSLDMVPQQFHFFLYLNPMTRIIQYSRSVIIDGVVPRAQGIAVSLLASMLICALGYAIFRAIEPSFADEL